MYPEVFRRAGMEVLAPAPEARELIHGVIFEELVRGKILESSRLRFNEIAAQLKAQGCDCVILGCTEIPLLVRADDCPLPTLDSTRLLAEAAVRHALGRDGVPSGANARPLRPTRPG